MHLESLENTWVQLPEGTGMLGMGMHLLGTGSQPDTDNPQRGKRENNLGMELGRLDREEIQEKLVHLGNNVK